MIQYYINNRPVPRAIARQRLEQGNPTLSPSQISDALQRALNNDKHAAALIGQSGITIYKGILWNHAAPNFTQTPMHTPWDIGTEERETMSNFPSYPDLLNIIKTYIGTDTSRASGIISDMTTTTPRQHTHLFRVQHDGRRRQNDKPTREQPILANPSKPHHHRPKTTGTDGGSYWKTKPTDKGTKWHYQRLRPHYQRISGFSTGRRLMK